MSADDPIVTPPPPPTASGRMARVEYLGFEDLQDFREYRLAANLPDGRVEFRFRIAIAAFGSAQMRLQDGPDVCYQKLLRDIGAGEAPPTSEVVTIGEVELASYRDTHTRVPKHRSLTSSFPPKPPAAPRPPMRPRALPAPVAPPLEKAPPAFEVGQRVNHAVFGAGVTTSCVGGHTVVSFDEGGAKKFVTSMLELELLSPPHTWETSPRGKNRPRETPAEPL